MKTFIDLFAGVGGFHLAFKNLAECVYVSEWDNNAKKTYLANFPEMENNFCGDIKTLNPISIPDFDILTAGFPCQPFSLAGKQLGFNHNTQGTLFFEIERILQHKKPKVIFLENVKNLVSHDKGKTFKIILDTLKLKGYFCKYQILNGKNHGNLPQNRERIFIVGFLNKESYENFKFPEQIPLTKTIQDCLEENILDKYYQNNLNSPSIQKMHQEINKQNTIYQYRRFYMRENKEGICPTLTANMGSGGHNVPLIMDQKGIRKLTPRECFNFQGFSVDFILPNIADTHLYKQAGNSIIVPLVKRIAENIIEVI